MVVFLFQPSFLELLKPRSWSCQRGFMADSNRLWPRFGLVRGPLLICKCDQLFSYFHYFLSLIYSIYIFGILFYGTKVTTISVFQCKEFQFLFTLTWKLQWCLIHVFKGSPTTKFQLLIKPHENSICKYYLFFRLLLL